MTTTHSDPDRYYTRGGSEDGRPPWRVVDRDAGHTVLARFRRLADAEAFCALAAEGSGAVHVTRVDAGGGVHGHSTEYCDPAGCAGHEHYWGCVWGARGVDVVGGRSAVVDGVIPTTLLRT